MNLKKLNQKIIEVCFEILDLRGMISNFNQKLNAVEKLKEEACMAVDVSLNNADEESLVAVFEYLLKLRDKYKKESLNE